MDIRVGSFDYTASTSLTAKRNNGQCSIVIGDVSLRTEIAVCGNNLAGRYLDAQMNYNTFLEIDDIYVCELQARF